MPDPTLSLNLGGVVSESKRMASSITPKSGPWDVIVVGSGAAGGMAAFQLTAAGVKVLMLEAGRMLDLEKEYRTMEWPYASMRRHRLPPGERALGVAEYDSTGHKRLRPVPHRHRAHPRRRPARHALRAAVPQHDRQASGLHPRLPLRGRGGQRVPGPGSRLAGFGRLQAPVRKTSRRFSYGRLRRGAAA